MWTKSRAEQGNISRRRRRRRRCGRGRKDARGVKATVAPLLLHAVDVARRGSGLLFGPVGSSSMFHGITMDHCVGPISPADFPMTVETSSIDGTYFQAGITNGFVLFI